MALSATAQSRHTTTQPAAWLSRTQLALALAFALALWLASAGYVYQESRRESQAQGMVTETLLVVKQALELENAALGMEASHRAYLITGAAGALANRDASHGRALQLARELVALVRDNPPQAERVRQSTVALQQRYLVMQQTSALAASAGLPAVRAGFLLAGDGSVESVHEALAAMRQEQQRLLAARMRDSDRSLAGLHAALVGVSGLALAILITAGSALLRELTRAERSSLALAETSVLHQALSHEFNAQAEQLKQSNHELESFSYSVSHDLRAPLRHIDAYARMLSEDAAGQLQPESQRYLHTIIDSARRMNLLIDGLLEFSRMGRQPLARQHVNMQELVERVVGEIRASNADGAAHIDVAALPSVDGDPALLRRVWMNLLSNAVKYSAPCGDQALIAVAGEQKGDHTHYWVRDNGVGFDMRYVDKLFGVFQRLHSQEQFEGAGVGLAIVQRIVSRHGGRVWAEGEPDRGATFTFELPAAEVQLMEDIA